MTGRAARAQPLAWIIAIALGVALAPLILWLIVGAAALYAVVWTLLAIGDLILIGLGRGWLWRRSVRRV